MPHFSHGSPCPYFTAVAAAAEKNSYGSPGHCSDQPLRSTGRGQEGQRLQEGPGSLLLGRDSGRKAGALKVGEGWRCRRAEGLRAGSPPGEKSKETLRAQPEFHLDSPERINGP